MNFETITMFHVTGNSEDIPQEVKDEVGKLWGHWGLDDYFRYFYWESEDSGEDYPAVDSFLKSHGITKCMIHYW